MSSSTAQLDGGPIQLSWPSLDGTQPYDHIAGILKLLHRSRGRDCPDHLWDPDKRFPTEMRFYWCGFLELRSAIRGRVLNLKEHGLSNTIRDRQVIDQRGRVGSLDQAVATYLNSLPQSLIPAGSAPRFLSTAEEASAQREFHALSKSVRDYIPNFEWWKEEMIANQKRDLDASNSLHRLCSLGGRFGDFTLRYRQSRILPKSGSAPQAADKSYNIGTDIQKRVSEVVSLSRTVGPIERATLMLWHQLVVPEMHRVPLPGNVTHFLSQGIEALELADVERGFKHVHGLISLTAMNTTTLSRHIQGALGKDKLGPVTLALLRAFVLSQPPINHCGDAGPVKEQLTLAEKQMLRLTSEYEGDLRLLQAIQAQV